MTTGSMTVAQLSAWAATAEFTSTDEVLLQATDGDRGYAGIPYLATACIEKISLAPLPNGGEVEISYAVKVLWQGTEKTRIRNEFTTERLKYAPTWHIFGIKIVGDHGIEIDPRTELQTVMEDMFGKAGVVNLTNINAVALIPQVIENDN